MTKLWAAVLVSGLLAGQEPTFRARSPLVLIPVTVSDRKGETLDGLGEQDFAVFDNDRQRTVHVDVAGTYRSHVSLVAVVQTSGIAKASLLKLRKLGILFHSYVAGDGGEVAVMSADENVKVVQDFTSDDSKIEECLEKLQTGGDTAGRVLEAVSEAVHMLSRKPPDHRRLIVTISESRDRSSKISFEQVLSAAQQHNVTIYTVTYSAFVTPYTTKASDQVLPYGGGVPLLGTLIELSRLSKVNMGEALAQSTGGLHTGFATLRALENDLIKIGKDVHSQYLLTLSPTEESQPSYHQLRISVAHHPEVLVRARPGYWTTEP